MRMTLQVQGIDPERHQSMGHQDAGCARQRQTQVAVKAGRVDKATLLHDVDRELLVMAGTRAGAHVEVGCDCDIVIVLFCLCAYVIHSSVWQAAAEFRSDREPGFVPKPPTPAH